MNKQDLIAHIAGEVGLNKVEAERALNAVISGVTQTLAERGSVTIVGFGTFSVANRAARVARNPRTGEEITISAMQVAKFKPGKSLKAAVA